MEEYLSTFDDSASDGFDRNCRDYMGSPFKEQRTSRKLMQTIKRIIEWKNI